MIQFQLGGDIDSADAQMKKLQDAAEASSRKIIYTDAINLLKSLKIMKRVLK